MARGDFSSSIDDRHNDEIGRLAHAYEGMRLALLERDRKLRGFTDTLQDQVRQRTSDLERAVLAAEEANRAKSLFLANMSHELRTPLNGVIGMVDLLLTTPMNAQQRRFGNIASVSVRSLLDLINDILDFSKIEAGKLELDSTDFDLWEAIEGVTQMLGDRAEKKQLELICAIDPQVPRRVTGDLVRFRQVLVNLVNNAIKFTERGEVAVSVTAAQEHERDCLVKVQVRDTGPGIPQNRLDKLFKSFSQVDASTTRRFGGTGLGLAISHRIVELMGGQTGVQSEEGKGSTFWFTALSQKSTAGPAVKRESSMLRGLRALVVDHNAASRQNLHAQLSSWSLRADSTSSPSEAMQMLRAAADGDAYRIVIADLHVPDNAGARLVRQIKSDPRTRQSIVIGLGPPIDPANLLELNHTDLAAYLLRPVLPSNLFNAIIGVLTDGSPHDPTPQAPRHPTVRLPGVRILVAEDNQINQLVAQEILQMVGCNVTVAANGRVAADLAMREQFDAVLMDCQMPEMDGFESTRLIRKLESELKCAPPPAHHRPDRQRHQRRPGTVPGGWNGRLRHQADRVRGDAGCAPGGHSQGPADARRPAIADAIARRTNIARHGGRDTRELAGLAPPLHGKCKSGRQSVENLRCRHWLLLRRAGAVRPGRGRQIPAHRRQDQGRGGQRVGGAPLPAGGGIGATRQERRGRAGAGFARPTSPGGPARPPIH